MREATLIFILIAMGFSVFGSNLSCQDRTASISKIPATYNQGSTSLLQKNISVDTICTSTSRDTLHITSVEKATDYEWSLPSGAFIFKKLSDTAIIVDWNNAVIGLNNICVTAHNTCGTSDNSCLEVFIEECNTKPVAEDDFEITTFNTPLTIHVQTNDRDANGDELTTLIDTNSSPNHGTLSILKLAIIYTPEQDYIGTDSFQYIICDNNHPILCDTAKVTVIIDHLAPIAINDMATTNVNTPILISVQENDEDPEGGVLVTTLDSLNLPLNGEVRIEGQNIIYTPNTGFTGVDRFDYIICDDGIPTKCSEATITISVTNSSPIAINDTINTTINNAIRIEVLGNDLDNENGTLTTTIDNNNLPTNGVLSIDGNTIIYTPIEGFNGIDQFNYVVCDDGNPILCDTATVLVNVGNNAPIAVNDSLLITSNNPINIDVLSNDIDPDGGVLTITIDDTTLPNNGMVTIDGNEITFTPISGFTGIDSIAYIICDEGIPSLCDTALVYIEVGNLPPTAMDDSAIIAANTSIVIAVQDNDQDIEGNNLTTFLDSLNLPLNGQVVVNGNDLIYIPNLNFTGTDRFDYIVCDDGEPIECSQATVTVFVKNSSPVAKNDTVHTSINNNINIAVQSNDTDPENGILITTLDPTNVPTNGVTSIDGNRITYTPIENYSGTDQFNYIICDNGNPILCDTAIVFVTIDNTFPIAINDTATIIANTPIIVDVLNNDITPDNGTITISVDINSLPDNGSVTIDDTLLIFTPIPGFTGIDSITYIICNEGVPSLCDTALVFIEGTNTNPIAVNDTISITPNTPIIINVINNDIDPDNGTITITIDSTSLPDNGSVSIEDTILIFTPIPGFTGTDSITYVICDEGMPSLCDTAIVFIEIINTNPIAVNDTVSITPNTPIIVDVLNNDIDSDNGTLTISVDSTSLSDNGSVSIEDTILIFTPIPGFTGTDSITYIVCDEGMPSLCDTAIVIIEITNTNPIAVNDTISIISNTPIIIDVLNNDIDLDNGTLTITIDSTSLPDNGSVSIEDTILIFTPIPGFTGTDSITYIICDEGIPSLCDTALVLINIGNTPPNAVDDIVRTELNTAIAISVMSNDSDLESGILQIEILSNNFTENGTLEIIPTDSTNTAFQILYTPTDGYLGLDSFSYVLCDNGNPVLCDTALVSIEVFNDAPVAIDDNIVTQERLPITSSVLLNDFDPNGHPLITELLTTPTKGTITLDSSGQYTYLPLLFENGLDSFSYSLCEAIAPFLCDTATVFIEIFPTNDPPIAINDINLTLENISTVGNVLTNDFDPEGNEIFATTTLVTPPINGEVSITSDGEYIYRPNFLYLGEDIFFYEVCDNGIPSLCDTAQVVIEVIGTEGNNNRPPIGVNDYFQTFVNTPISGDVISNDIEVNGATIRINTEPVIPPTEGILEISTIGTFFFIPALDKIGIETFTYEICNFLEPTLCETVLVQIEILPNIGNAVHATDDAASGLEDQVIRGNVLANDTDPEGDDLFLQIAPITLPTNGNVVLQENGDFEYQPIKDYNGPDNFIYEVCDNGIPQACDRATVELIILPVVDTLCSKDITAPSILGTNSVCGNDSIHLFVQTDPSPLTIENQNTPLEYVWFNGRGDIIATTINKQLSLPISPSTISPFSMRVRSGICSSPLSNLVPVEIVHLPEIFISIDRNTDSLCANTAFQLSAPFVSSARYEWSTLDNPIAFSRDQNVTIEDLTENTTYQLSVISEVCESISIARKTVHIFSDLQQNNPPTVALQSDGTCGENTLILNANIPTDSTNAIQIEWTGPNNYTSFMAIDTLRSATTAANGQYTLVLTDGNTCQTTSNILVTGITPSVTKPIITSVEGPVCENGNILLQAPSYEGRENDYTWFKNGEVVEEEFTNQLFIDDAQLRDSFSFSIPIDDCVLNSNVFVPIVFEKPRLSLDSAFQLFCSSGTEDIEIETSIEGGQGPFTIEWVGPNNFFSVNPNPTLVNASEVDAGTYMIAVTDQNGCIADASTIVDIIDNLPTPILALSGNSCDGEQLELSVINYEGREVNYEWSVPNEEGIPSLTTSAIRIPAANEQYIGAYILITDSGTCMAQSDTFHLENFDILTATPEAIYERSENCAAANLELFANATGANLSFQWTGPNGFSSNLMNPIITNATTDNNGIYELLINNSQGCSIVVSTNIIDSIQNGFPEPVLQTNGLACAGGFITITAPIYTGTSVSYTWFENGNQLENENGPVLVAGPLQSDSMEYELIVEVDDCTLRSDLYTIENFEDISATPEAIYERAEDCAAANLELFANTTGSNLSYQWTGPNGFSSNLMNPIISNATTDNNGIYELLVSNPQGCSIVAATNIIDNIQNGFPEPVLQPNGLACAGGFITLTAPIYTGTSVSYTWFENGNQLENENGPVLVAGPLQADSIEYELMVQVDDCILRSDSYILENVEAISATPEAIYERAEDCAAANLELFANATGANLSYQWTGPNGFSSNLMNPIISNATTDNNGIYELLISNPQGCSFVAASNVIDNIQNGFPEPVLQPSGLICAGGFITLTAPVYTGTSVSYTWFENGNELENENGPVLVAGPLQTDGIEYELVVQVEDCILRSDPYFTDVIEELDLELDFQLSSTCGAAEMQLIANLSVEPDNFNFSWAGPNGFSAGSLEATILRPTPENNGLYTLKISNESGCESSADLFINSIVSAPDEPIIQVISNECEPDILLVVENQVMGANYSWTDQDGAIVGNTAQLNLNNTAAGNGPYQVAITVDGCEAIPSLPFLTESIEQIGIQIGNSGPICLGMDATLFATNLDGYNYEWYDENDALIATESSTTISAVNEATTYTLIVTKDGCSNEQIQQTEVLIETIPEVTNITKSETYCEGESIFLTAQNSNPIGELIRYTWTGPNGFSFTEESTTDSFNLTLPSINISQAGSYSLQIATPNGCMSETNSVLVNVIPGIAAPALAVEQTAICAGSTLSLEARSTAVTAVAYEWYLQRGSETPTLIATTDLPNFIIENATSDNSGTYIVKAANERCTSNFSNQVPVLVFDVNTDLTISSNTSDTQPGCYGDVLQLSLPFYPNASYRWFGPAGFTSSAHNPIVESLKDIHEGEYFAIIEMEGCQEVMTSPLNVIVNPTPATPTAINSGPICIRDDLEFQVNSIVENGSNIRFDWFNSSGVLVGSSDNPLQSFSNVPALFNDQYHVEITIDGCTSDPSISMDVQVNDPSALEAIAGEDQEFCATAAITLAATPPVFGQGIWRAIDGGSLANANVATTEVNQLQKGVNRFIWTVNDEICAVQEIDTVSISVGNVTVDQAIAGADQDLCEEYTTTLTANPIIESTGRWVQSAAQSQQGVQLGSPSNAQTSVIGLEAGNSYTFNWVISQADCPDFESDEIIINVNDIPNEHAIIQEEVMFLCGENNTNLDAELPGLSIGQWSYIPNVDTTGLPAVSPIRIAAATNASTFVEGIPPGDNMFVWSLTNGACKDFSSDTIQILGASELIANPDEYVINVNDSIAIDILQNDVIAPDESFNVVIVQFPNFGDLIENGDGTYMYQPINNYFGRDDFKYIICNANCENLCDTTDVSLVVNGIEGSGACFIPNVISPNKDGNNDIFTVACIDDFPNNQLSIFNRWGDQVFTAAPYRNNWAGTYQGQDLPAGTYFYILQLSDQGEPLQGFITIFR